VNATAGRPVRSFSVYAVYGKDDEWVAEANGRRVFCHAATPTDALGGLVRQLQLQPDLTATRFGTGWAEPGVEAAAAKDETVNYD
jgi:hypothetical protein